MLLLLSCLFAAATAVPITVDQRQEGELNIRADLKNVVLLVAIPQKLPFTNLLGGFKSNSESQIQERADVHSMDAFLEPSTPYQVDLTRDHNYEGDGRAVEVLIAGRRSSIESDQDEIKLIGATEQCGPGRSRDPVSLTCREDKGELQPNKVETVSTKEKADISPVKRLAADKDAKKVPV